MGQTGAMSLRRTSTVDHVPEDPVGEAAARAVVDMLGDATAELVYAPDEVPLPRASSEATMASAAGEGPDGWHAILTVRLGQRLAPLVTPTSSRLLGMLAVLPESALHAAARFRPAHDTASAPLGAPLRRVLRDTIVVEALGRQPVLDDRAVPTELIAEVLDFLIELGGTRVESRDLTHGVVVADVLRDTPRLQFDYPGDLRPAKRGPLLFDGQRAILLVDPAGRARTEIQHHRLDRFIPGVTHLGSAAAEFVDSGSLVATATRHLGGIGFFLRSDRAIVAFVDGQPLVIRRAERWTAFPLELTAAIDNAVGGSRAAPIVVQAAFAISAERRGAILAIVDDAACLEGIVSVKDRYDMRDEFDPVAMRPETRLHHLIDAERLDEQILARVAILDGATVLDRDGNLLAYGAIVSTRDSQHEGARTAAAKTLSETAEVVLMVSQDGDITVFRHGRIVANLLGWGGTAAE